MTITPSEESLGSMPGQTRSSSGEPPASCSAVRGHPSWSGLEGGVVASGGGKSCGRELLWMGESAPSPCHALLRRDSSLPRGTLGQHCRRERTTPGGLGMAMQHRVGEEWVPGRERARDCGPVNFVCGFGSPK